MPEQPHIPPADEFPRYVEPYQQGYAPIAISRGHRREAGLFKITGEVGAILIALSVAFGLVYLGVHFVAWVARLIFGGAM